MRRWPTVAVVAATAAVYLVAAVVETGLAYPEPRRVTGWWPSGVAVAATWLAGRRAAPGAFLGDLLFVVGTGVRPWWIGLASGTGNALEALLGAALLRRFGYRPELERVQDVVALTAAAIVCPVTMVVVQTPAAVAAGWGLDPGLWRTAVTWLANDTVGILFVLPLLAVPGGWRELRAAGWAARAEAGGLLLAVAVAAGLAFGTQAGDWRPALTAAAFPPLTWVALRFWPGLAATALALYAGVIAAAVALRLDPFPADGWFATFPTLHLLLGVVGVTGLLLAAVTAERRAAERQAVAAAKWEAMAGLAAGLAHEFNNRLTGVIGHIDLAALDLPPGSPAAAHLAEGQRAALGVADLTRLIQAAGGRPSLRREWPVDLGEAARAAAGPGVAVTVAPGSLTTLADPELVRLAVGHVLANAVEAAGPAAVEVAVTREAVAADAGADVHPGPHVRVRVRDAGPGMAPGVAAKALDLFFSTKFPGRGLGLPVARGAVASAGGFLRLDTAPGQGTTVDLYWPAAD